MTNQEWHEVEAMKTEMARREQDSMMNEPTIDLGVPRHLHSDHKNANWHTCLVCAGLLRNSKQWRA